MILPLLRTFLLRFTGHLLTGMQAGMNQGQTTKTRRMGAMSTFTMAPKLIKRSLCRISALLRIPYLLRWALFENSLLCSRKIIPGLSTTTKQRWKKNSHVLLLPTMGGNQNKSPRNSIRRGSRGYTSHSTTRSSTKTAPLPQSHPHLPYLCSRKSLLV